MGGKAWLNAGALQLFETFAEKSEFYQRLAKPLLSMHNVGSIGVERRIKPIKHNILIKKQNRLHDPKGVALYIAQGKLNHIMSAKKILGKKISDSLLA